MNLKTVFEAHPEATELYTVNGVPFVDKQHATNYSHECGENLATVTRADFEARQEAAEKLKAEAEKVGKAEAEKKAAAEKKAKAAAAKKAKAEADKKAKAAAAEKAEGEAKSAARATPEAIKEGE